MKPVDSRYSARPRAGFIMPALGLAAAASLSFSPAHAQVPSITVDGLPATPLIGEVFCTAVNFTNASGPTGYGPYLVGVIAPGVSRFSVDFVDVPPRLIEVGTFGPDGQLVEPISETTLTGEPGGAAVDALYPVGGVETSKPPLVMDVCAVVDVGTEVGVPLNVEIIPGFEFGDSPTGPSGAGGTILGTPFTSTITPQLARIEKTNSAPENERPPGPSHVFNYAYNINISAGVTIEDLAVSDLLPDQIQWTGGTINISAPLGQGCAVTNEPNLDPTPGGELLVECDTVTGTTNVSDLTISLPVYIVDILDETIADSQVITNTVTFDYTYKGDAYNDTADSVVEAKHGTAQKTVSGVALPGQTLTYSVAFQITDYPDTPGAGANNLIFSDILPDGTNYIETLPVQISGLPPTTVVPILTPGPNGVTNAAWDITSETGTLANGTTGTLTYRVRIEEFYDNGDPVLASDTLTNQLDMDYGLTEGAQDSDNSESGSTITPNTPDKEVLNYDPSDQLMPGEEVTFRLTLELPAGKTRDVVLIDYLPRPVFDVADFDLNTDVVIPPESDVQQQPTKSKNAGDNTVTLDYGDINLALNSTLIVDLNATVTGEPFSDDLFLTNLLASSYTNTDGTVIQELNAAELLVGAPELVITKGVLAVDNAAATIDPPPGQLPVDGDATNVDAGDEIQYQITIENIGGQSAYTVRVQDAVVNELDCDPVATVVNGNGDVLAYTGSLANPQGLRLTDPLPGNDGNPAGGGPPYGADTALITATCTLEGTVTPDSSITNRASVRWVSTPGGNEFFPPQEDEAKVTVARPSLTKELIDIIPGYASGQRNAHIGEVVTYQVDIRIPEGTSPQARLIDTLEAGLAFIDLIGVQDLSGGSLSTSLTAFSPGDFSPVLNNDGYYPEGMGDYAEDRRLAIGPGLGDNGFGDIRNTDTNNNTDEILRLTYTTRVLNWTGNVNAEQRRNSAEWSWERSPGKRRTVSKKAAKLTIREPDLDISKRIIPDTGDDATVPTVEIQVAHSGSSSTDAFDLSLIDALPDPMSVSGGVGAISITGASCPANTVDLDTDEVLTVNWDSFPLGSNCTISFPVAWLRQLIAGEVITNCSDVEWESLADSDQPLASPPTNVLGVERTGDPVDPGGSANTYREENCDSFKVFDVGMTKDVFSTSQSHTDNIPGTPDDTESLTIGEQVTYQLTVTIPNGISANLVVTDLLPVTEMVMELVDAETLQPPGADLRFILGDPDPPPIISDSNLDGINDKLELDYGFVENLSNDATTDDDRIFIRVTALVVDQQANQNNDLENNAAIASFTVPGGQTLNSTDEFGVELVEPLLRIEKTADVTEVEANDVITYNLRLSHRDASRVDAFDLVLDDMLPPELILVPASSGFGATCTALPDAPVFEDIPGNSIRATWASFPLGAVCDIEFQARVDIAAISGSTITNEADLAWTSLDTQGEANDRDYKLDDSWDVVVTLPGLGKGISDTSIPETGGRPPSADLTIGETVTFELVANFPDGTTEGVRLLDLLPGATQGVALEFVDTEILAIGDDLTIGTNPAEGDPAGACTPPDKDCVSWILGDVVNQPDDRDDPDVGDQILFQVTAIVLDDALNSGAPGEDKNVFNTGKLENTEISLTAIAPFNIVEPQLAINKLTEDGSKLQAVSAGQEHTFTLQISHTNDSTAIAFDLLIADTLDNQMLWVGDDRVSSNCPGFAILQAPAPDTTGPLAFEADGLATGRVCEIQFTVRLRDDAPAVGRFPNSVTLEWESAPGSPETRVGKDNSRAELFSYDIPNLIKLATATSLPQTGNSQGDPALFDTTIGEVTEFEITVSFPEGTSQDVVLEDALQQDGNGFLELVGGELIYSGNNLVFTGPGTVDITGNVITVDLGDVINLADSIQDRDDNLEFRLLGRTRDEPVNVDGITLTNTAVVDISTPLGSSGDNDSVDVVEPGIAMTKTFTSLVDTVATIRLEISNTGTAPAFDLMVDDVFDETLWLYPSLVPITVPNGFSLTDSSDGSFTTVTLAADGPADNPPPEQVLDPNEVLIVEFSMQLANGGQLPVTRIDNTAQGELTSLPGDALDPNDVVQERVYTTDATDTLFLPRLEMIKTWSGPNDPAKPGDTLTYTLSLTNVGEAPTTDTTINDTPDSIGEFQAGTVTINAGANPDPGAVVTGNNPGDTTVETFFNTVDAGATVAVNYDVIVPMPYPAGIEEPQQFVNQAEAASSELPPLVSDDPTTPDDPNDPTIVPIEADPIMQLVKDDQVNFTLPGETLVYALTYSNVGDQNATGVVITETIPDNTVFDPLSSDFRWNCPTLNPGTVCTLPVGNLAGGSSEVALFAVIVDDPLATSVTEITNLAEIEEDGLEFGGVPSTPSTATDDEITPVFATPALDILKDDGGISVVPGQVYSYFIRYQNTGNQNASNVVITETVPDDVVFDAGASAPAGRWSCSGTLPGSTCTLDVGDLPATFARLATFGLRVIDPVAAGIERIFNEVLINDDGANTGGTPLEAMSEDTTPLLATPDLTVRKQTDAGVVRLNDVITYEINYRNQGNQDATGVIVSELVPPGTVFSSDASQPTSWSCGDAAPAGTICDVFIGNLPAGSGGTLSFGVEVVEQTENNNIINLVVVRDDGTNGPDPTPGNNVDVVTNSFPEAEIPVMSRYLVIMLTGLMLLLGTIHLRRQKT